MQLILESDRRVWRVGEAVIVRLLALNDSYEVVTLDRRLLVGPHPMHVGPNRSLFGVSLEPTFPQEEQNILLLNPWCFYGRQRTFEHLAEGQLSLYGYLLSKPADALLPKGPVDADKLLAAAEPLVLTISAG